MFTTIRYIYLNLSLPKATRVLGCALGPVLLREELERTLLRLVARLDEAAVSLLARSHLLTAHDLSTLVLQEILARQPTLGVLRRAVVNLCLGTRCEHTSIHRLHVCAVHAVHVSNGTGDFFLVLSASGLLLAMGTPSSQSMSPFA